MPPGDQESDKADKVDKSDELVQKWSFYDFQPLFALLLTFLGVLPGFSARITHLFQDIPLKTPYPAGLNRHYRHFRHFLDSTLFSGRNILL